MNYLTITEFRALDEMGTYQAYGDTTVGQAITQASLQIDLYRGHTFEDRTDVTEYFDGPYCEVLDLRRAGGLPLRELLEISINDSTVNVASIIPYPLTGPPYIELRRKIAGGDPYPAHWAWQPIDFGDRPKGVKVRGHWGWTSIPEKVKIACFRLAGRYLTGEAHDLLGRADQMGAPIRRMELQSGTTVEWAVKAK